jgi:shikimate kinase
MPNNILLIGLTGVGKTTVARGVAKELEMDFFDTDMELEYVTGLKLKDIYRKYGEIRFRSEELLVMKKIAKKNNCVVSVGTSLSMTDEIKTYLPQQGKIVWLNGNLDIIKERIKRKYNKVLLPKGVNMKNFDEWAQCRYSEFKDIADYVVEVDNKDLDGVINCIVYDIFGKTDPAF